MNANAITITSNVRNGVHTPVRLSTFSTSYICQSYPIMKFDIICDRLWIVKQSEAPHWNVYPCIFGKYVFVRTIGGGPSATRAMLPKRSMKKVWMADTIIRALLMSSEKMELDVTAYTTKYENVLCHRKVNMKTFVHPRRAWWTLDVPHKAGPFYGLFYRKRFTQTLAAWDSHCSSHWEALFPYSQWVPFEFSTLWLRIKDLFISTGNFSQHPNCSPVEFRLNAVCCKREQIQTWPTVLCILTIYWWRGMFSNSPILPGMFA